MMSIITAPSIDLPTFILHVGPSKSGTSLIQSFFESKKIRPVLQMDNIAVVNHKIMRPSKSIVGNSQLSYQGLLDRQLSSPLDPFKGEFRRFMSKQKKNSPRTNIFGSHEKWFVPLDCDAWKRILSNDGSTPPTTRRWKLHVIVAYRRYHSYLPSSWNQYSKYRRAGDLQKLGPHKYWPGVKGDTRIKSFAEWFSDDFFTNKYEDVRIAHYAYSSYNAWKSCSDSITLIDYHDSAIHLQNGSLVEDGDLVTNFACSGIIGASHTCSKLIDSLQERREAPHKNPSEILDYDIIATHAHKLGLVGHDVKRQDAARRIEKFAKSRDAAANTSFPIKCPNSETLAQIYNVSLEAEIWAQTILAGQGHDRQLFGKGLVGSNLLDAEQLRDFNRDWNRTLDDKKFCTVDAEEVVQQKEWKDFFKKSFA